MELIYFHFINDFTLRAPIRRRGHISNTRNKNRRIVVTGDPCTGKTTLARLLSNRLGIPHIELDLIRDNAHIGYELDISAFRKEVSARLKSETWVACGCYIENRDVIWINADAIIWLDYSLPVIFLRQVRRSFYRLVLNIGNRPREKHRPRSLLAVKREFMIFRYILSHYIKRKQIEMILQNSLYLKKEISRLASPRETREWLKKIRAYQSHINGIDEDAYACKSSKTKRNG